MKLAQARLFVYSLPLYGLFAYIIDKQEKLSFENSFPVLIQPDHIKMFSLQFCQLCQHGNIGRQFKTLCKSLPGGSHGFLTIFIDSPVQMKACASTLLDKHEGVLCESTSLGVGFLFI